MARDYNLHSASKDFASIMLLGACRQAISHLLDARESKKRPKTINDTKHAEALDINEYYIKKGFKT